MTDDLYARYRGRSVPGLGDEWRISSVAYRAYVAGGDVEQCVQTGRDIPPKTEHLYVTARGETGLEIDEFRHYVLKDEAALKEWLDE